MTDSSEPVGQVSPEEALIAAQAGGLAVVRADGRGGDVA